MELPEGETLAARLECGRLAIRAALNTTLEIAAALTRRKG